MMKKVVSLLASLSMLLSLVCLTALPVTAAAEGDWTTSRSASEYPKEGAAPDKDKVYKPEAGYTYTSEGFTVVPADYKDTTPFMTVQTKEPQYIKDGIYLQFRVDDYSYGGDAGADQWIAISLNSKPRVAIGNTGYGGGWVDCIRGSGNGVGSGAPCVTLPNDGDVAGYFKPIGSHDLTVPLDDEGREIYTFEVKWTGKAYEIRVNGSLIPGGSEATEMLETIDPDARFYVGVTLYSMVKSGTAALTILKYGTSEADASTPTGSDSKQPEENLLSFADIADPSTVEAGMPAILWNPETVNMGAGYNCTLAPLGDNTWRVTASDPAIFFGFSPKRTQSYDGTDFPVFSVLMRNTEDLNGGSLWYAAGEFMGAQNDHILPFDTYDGEFYESGDDEYVVVSYNLSDVWEGRINSIRLDFAVYDGAEFDICYAGMFRSEEEAAAYAENYLTAVGVLSDGETAAETAADTAADTAAEEVTAADTDTQAADTAADTEAESAPAETEQAESAAATEAVGGGCSSSAAGMCVTALVCGAVLAVVRKRKD